MKKYHILLFAFLLILSPVHAEEPEFVNSSRNAPNVAYKIADVGFEYTQNTFYLHTGFPYMLIQVENEKQFDIRDLYVYNNGKLIQFLPRPVILLENGKYSYKQNITLSNGSNNVKVVFKRNDVEVLVSPRFYPFDRYRIVSDRNITEGFSFIASYNLPKVDLVSSSVSINEASCMPVIFSVRDRMITWGNEVTTSESSIINGRLSNTDMALYTKVNGEYEKVTTVYCDNANKKEEITFRRSFYPAIFLFLLLLIYGSLMAIENIKRKKPFGIQLYGGYLASFMIIEFIAGILPTSRPSMLTLFDLLIFLPIGIICLYGGVKKYIMPKFKNFFSGLKRWKDMKRNNYRKYSEEHTDDRPIVTTNRLAIIAALVTLLLALADPLKEPELKLGGDEPLIKLIGDTGVSVLNFSIFLAIKVTLPIFGIFLIGLALDHLYLRSSQRLPWYGKMYDAGAILMIYVVSILLVLFTSIVIGGLLRQQWITATLLMAGTIGIFWLLQKILHVPKNESNKDIPKIVKE